MSEVIILRARHTHDIYSCTVLMQTHRGKLGRKATGRIVHETSQNSFADGGLGTE